jgi:hypothetical protein
LGRLTVNGVGQVPVADVANAVDLMQAPQQAVVVEGQGCPTQDAQEPGGPTQVGEDERRVAQDEGCVHSRHQMESDCPSWIWKFKKHYIQHRLPRHMKRSSTSA